VRKLPTEVPWDFTAAPDPGAPAVINLPTPAGSLLGRHLARLCDQAEAEQRKTFPDQHPRCHDCAFRKGTRPNGCEGTLMDAIKCVVEQRPFLCHVGLKNDEEPEPDNERLCRGWLIMISTSAEQEAAEAAEAGASSAARQNGCMPILLGPVEDR
jgi:hypothetical protein